jgi:hypothetical protein
MTMTFECVGPPPERHANRVVAGMLRDLARKRARLEIAIGDAIASSKDGNPKAQLKMAARMRQAGAEDVLLEPGKRGRYTILIFHWTGWDPIRDRAIHIDSPIPEKPWLAYHIHYIENRGRGMIKAKSVPMLMITHHALSRAAQRFETRTNEHMFNAARHIRDAAVPLILKKDWTPPPPPQGLRLPLDTDDGAIVVLRQHESRERTLVAATVFAPNET